MKRMFLICLFQLMLVAPALAQEDEQLNKDFVGAVQTIRTERSNLLIKDGKPNEGKKVLSSIYTYDPTGKLSESEIYKPDGVLFKKYKASYDVSTNKREEIYFEPKGSIDAKFITTNDVSAKTSAVIYSNSKGEVLRRIVYKFDEQGRQIEEIIYDKKGNLERKLFATYDSDNRGFIKYYDKQGTFQYSLESAYHKNSRTRETVYKRPDNSIIVKLDNLYDGKGNLLQETYDLGSSGRQWRYEYEFDSTGNWVKQKQFELDIEGGKQIFKPISLTYRAITYYPEQTAKEGAKEGDLLIKKMLSETRSVLTGEAIKRFEPGYPNEAKTARKSGTVLILVIASEQGDTLVPLTISSPHKSLSEASEIAAWQWKFSPTIRGGKLNSVIGTITFNFNL